MASKSEFTPTVKAYEYGNTIIVKYYDNGEANTLSCPLCYWFGSMDLSNSNDDLGVANSTEVRCPDCNTKLASIALPTQRKA